MEDIKTGVGIGSSQVFNLSGLTNMYVRMMQERMVKDQKEAYAVQEMMKEYDPNKQGVRSQDIGLYNKKYQEFKNVYIQNKGLYTNPSSNPDAYMKAQKILGEMKSISADSKALNEFYPTMLKAHLDSKGMLFDDKSVDILGKIASADVSSVKMAFGGRLPNMADFEYKEKPIDLKKYNETLFALADQGAHSDKILSTAHPTDKFKTVDVTKRYYSYDAISSAVNKMGNADRDLDKTFTKRYNYAKEFHPENISKIETEIRKVPGLQNYKIADGRDYASAFEYLNSVNGIDVGKPKITTNEAAKIKEQQTFTSGQNALNRDASMRMAEKRAEETDKKRQAVIEMQKQIGAQSTVIYNLASAGTLTTETLRGKFPKLTNIVGMDVTLKGADDKKIISALTNYNKNKWNTNYEIPYTGDESSPEFSPELIKKIKKTGVILFTDNTNGMKYMPIIPGVGTSGASQIAQVFMDATSAQEQKTGTSIPGIDSISNTPMFNGN